MEGAQELIVEKRMNEFLKGELAEAFKTIEEKEAENQRLLEKIAVLEKRLQSKGDVNDRETEVRPSRLLERKAEEIIPKECWRLVFLNLDGEDMLSCRQVCRTFNQVLDAKDFKIQWKFKLILPLLFPYLKTIDPEGYPSWEHLYNARLTCRSWRHSIDKYASEVYETSFFPLPQLASQMLLVTRFRSFQDIEEFQERAGERNTNPFPSRSVYISGPSFDQGYTEESHNAYLEKVGYLLVQFGKHIIRLRLCADFCIYEQGHYLGRGADPLALCKLIKRITIHLPNLKELLIHDACIIEVDDGEVKTYIAENALAALPKLRALNIQGLNEEVEKYLLDAFGSQLTRFETTFSENLSQFQIQRLKNVRKLWLRLYEPSDTLENLRFLESPLKLLKLMCCFISAPEAWNVDKLLCNLKHLPIETLDLEILSRGHGGTLVEAGLDMEEYNNATIKTLIIHINRGDVDDACRISFNFLQALTKLENLELKFSDEHLRTTHPRGLPEVVKLNQYLFGQDGTDLPYHSNVWEKVPSLKTLTTSRLHEIELRDGEFVVVNKSIFTREKYEKIIAEGDFLEQG